MQLINIGGHDFTESIIVPSYVVDKKDIFITWTDGNHVERRHKTRTKVSGSFNMFFNSVEEYKTFLSCVNDNKQLGGYIPNCKVYCNNIDEVELVDLFIDYDFPDLLPVIGTKENEECTINITER